jgi:hypothetical protein
LSFHELRESAESLGKEKINLTPARVVVVGRDISVGSRPIANSVSALLVAFMFANSYEPSSLRSSKPPAIMTFAFPDKIVSHAISRDWRAVALAGVKYMKKRMDGWKKHEPSSDRNLDWAT